MKDNPAVPPTSTEDPKDSPRYPYIHLLQQLESKAYESQSLPQHPAVAHDTTERHTSSQPTPWDLSHDALLATLLHEFSNHVVQRTREVSLEVRKLQSSVNKVGVDVALVQTEWMKSSRDVFMEQVVSDDTENEKAKKFIQGGTRNENEELEKDLGPDDDDSAAEIARLEAEEQAAIRDGMKALSLFFDPKQSTKISENGTDDELGFDDDDDLHAFNGDDDVIGDSCYYYPSAKDDAFNQRPLPFIVGSREFMESSSAGLGALGDENAEVVHG
ncbi:hypothetical protein HJC23_012901 [Cyclotella cryptica]|uniref:Uncharacterized protein n=1 Tax=Cyclotella cryptica TaxID=29204 RepID=A0ABD3Q2R8_9STRA|eukprot:CCRYP_009478-RA/>CCRYP_009478-RA protein AED:0.19 eAED:0.19 QI:175/-1/1/1/-1/1/1/92/272